MAGRLTRLPKFLARTSRAARRRTEQAAHAAAAAVDSLPSETARVTKLPNCWDGCCGRLIAGAWTRSAQGPSTRRGVGTLGLGLSVLGSDGCGRRAEHWSRRSARKAIVSPAVFTADACFDRTRPSSRSVFYSRQPAPAGFGGSPVEKARQPDARLKSPTILKSRCPRGRFAGGSTLYPGGTPMPPCPATASWSRSRLRHHHHLRHSDGSARAL